MCPPPSRFHVVTEEHAHLFRVDASAHCNRARVTPPTALLEPAIDGQPPWAVWDGEVSLKNRIPCLNPPPQGCEKRGGGLRGFYAAGVPPPLCLCNSALLGLGGIPRAFL